MNQVEINRTKNKKNQVAYEYLQKSRQQVFIFKF